MTAAGRKENFELAARLRNKIFSLEHIQDVAVIKSEISRDLGDRAGVNIFGRIEGYDISNISGTSATGSMVVFTDGKPNKDEYRKFKIKTVSTPNDVAMMKEIIARRLTHSSKKNNQSLPVTRYPLPVTKIWPLPNLILVDGGWGQINAVKEILSGQKIKIPVLGIAKGFDRKQDRLLYGEENPELGRLAGQYKDILLQVRDEAHRFAISYHKLLRKKKLLNKK